MAAQQDSFSSLINGLQTRQQEVVKSRFGLTGAGVSETLAAIGERYGITRERVRQIEGAALKNLKEAISANSYFQRLLEQGKKFLKNNLGISSREALLDFQKKSGFALTQQQLALVLASSGAFFFRDEDEDFHALYFADQKAFDSAATLINSWSAELESNKDHILKNSTHYDGLLAQFIKTQSVPRGQFDRYLSISKRIGQNPYGDRGLASWPEINPMTVRDRIYLVLKKETKPLHFQTIAKYINKSWNTSRPALAPTCHNELIKDDRFVLVGRGMYALAEHGYLPGTAREVIVRVLKQAGPLRAKEVVAAVQKERFIKHNTILVNLQNKDFFHRLSDGSYQVRES